MSDEEPTTPSPRTRKRRRRWPWVLAVLPIVLLVSLRAALPTLIERGAAYGSRQWLGLPVRIENADFDLAEGIVVLEGVSVGAEPEALGPDASTFDLPSIDPATALLHLERIAVHLSWQDLREHRIHLSELALDSPTIRVLREADGAIDPLRHARPLALPSTEPEDAAKEKAEPWPLLLDAFALRAPNVVIVDPPSGQKLLEFSLDRFALDHIATDGSQFSLGGVAIEGPLLRVRRDLVFATASPKIAGEAAAPSPTDSKDTAGIPPQQAEPPAPGATPPPAADVKTEEAAAPGAKSSELRIENIDIARATFVWVTDKGPLDVALSLKASGVTASQGKHFPVDLQLEIDKGRIGFVGEIGVLPPSCTGKLAWSGLPFPPLLLASLPELAPWLRSADSTGDLVLDVDPSGLRGSPALHLAGHLTVERVDVVNPGEREISLGWKQFEVNMKEVVVPLPSDEKAFRPVVAALDTVRLVEPQIRYVHPSRVLRTTLGLPQDVPPAAKIPPTKTAAAKPVATKAPAAQRTAAPPPSAPAPVRLAIGLLELVAGDLEVVDTTVSPSVTSTVKGLSLTAHDVRFPDPAARAVEVRATLPKGSLLKVSGDLAAGNKGDFKLSLQKLDLPMFSPYAKAAGASLDAGSASIETKVKIRGAKMEVDNELVLRKFGVSLRDPSSFDRNFGVPIDMALALLRDPSGNIKLTIPVRVDEKGARVSMGAIIASALKGALIGAVTAPLKLLGGAIGGVENVVGGLFGLPPLRSPAGRADLDGDAPARAEGFVKLLEDRPSMALVLKGRTGDGDKKPLAERLLLEGVKSGKGLPDLEGSGLLARRRISQALMARDKADPDGKAGAELVLDPQDRQLFDRYVSGVSVPTERFDALAAKRSEKARALLLAASIDPARITIADREADGDPGVVVTLSANPAPVPAAAGSPGAKAAAGAGKTKGVPASGGSPKAGGGASSSSASAAKTAQKSAGTASGPAAKAEAKPSPPVLPVKAP